MPQYCIDFDAIKRRVAMSAVLEHYRIENLKVSGKAHLRGRCPLHGGEGTQTFHVDTAQQVFHCFSCQAGGSVLDFVMAIEGCGLREAAERLSSWNHLAAHDHHVVMQTVTKKRECIPHLGFRLRGVDPRHPYPRTRGIEEATAVEFGVGFYSGPGLMHDRLVVPIQDGVGELVGYCGRALDGSEPRYKFPPQFPKSRLLFNLHRAIATRRPDVTVVEGFFDCLKVWQAGFRSVVALMGSSIYEEQCRILIQKFRRIRLMLDGDFAGRRGTSTITRVLAACRSVEVVDLADGIQPDHLAPDSLREILGTRRPI
jgi:DNA primase